MGDPIETDTAAKGTPAATSPGNPDIPMGYPDGPGVAPSLTPYRPTSVPPVVTAGAMRRCVQFGAAWALGWVVLML